METVCITKFAHLVSEDGDWTQAFQAALNSARVVTVPPGEYNAAGPLHLDSDQCIRGD